MDILDALTTRRAVYPRDFTGDPVTDDDIRTLLDAANWAPTHRYTEPWRFRVVRGDGLTRLADFMDTVVTETVDDQEAAEAKRVRTRSKIEASTAVLILSMQRDPGERVPAWEELAATAMAVQNLWLAGYHRGIGGYWSSPAAAIERIDRFTPLDEGERCLGFFYLGRRPDGDRPGRRFSSAEEKTRWVRA